MSKKQPKIVAVSLAISLFGLAAVGCAGEVEQVINKEVTNLYISNYNGGYGDDYLLALERRFEEKYKDYVNEETGKVGVDVHINNSKSKGPGALVTMVNGPDEVFFVESVPYTDMLTSNVALDITDVVTATNPEDGNKAISDKMTDYQKSYFGVQENGRAHYYAIPNYTSYGSISYNEDVFYEYSLFLEGDENRDYFAKKLAYGYAFTNDSAKFSVGPDGKRGTSDDGLPATFDEFSFMLAEMRGRGVTPFIWSGQNIVDYVDWYLIAVATNIAGIDSAQNMYTFDRAIKNVVEVDQDNQIVLDANGKPVLREQVQIDKTNGYLAYYTDAIYYALSFYESIFINSDNYSSKVESGTHSHTDAQNDFLKSYYVDSQPIAMILEGDWWYNEAREIGSIDYVCKNGFARDGSKLTEDKINVKRMALPMPDESYITGRTTVSCEMDSLALIKNTISSEKIDIAKKFLQFAYTDQSLREFTSITSTVKDLNYDMGDDFDSMCPYGKSVVEVHNGEQTDKVYPYATNSTYLAGATVLGASIFKTQQYSNAYTAFKGYKLTTEEFVNGIYKIWTPSYWAANYANK